MRKEYNQEEIERILKQDASIPETVEQRFRTAYENLGLTDITSAAGRSHTGSSTESMRHRRKKKALLVIAAAAVLTMGLGITALAVNHFLNVNLVEEDGTLAYDVSVNTEEKEAHLVTAEPTYVPEGYVYHPEEGPYHLKWHNDATDGGMTIVVYNAAELDKMSRTDHPIISNFDKSSFVETVNIQDMRVDLFSATSLYSDDPSTRQDVFLFNEEYGYAIQIYLAGVDLPEDEALKVAEGLDIQVSDETVPFATEEEIAKEKELQDQLLEAQQDLQAGLEAPIDPVTYGSLFYQIGDTITSPDDPLNNSQYRITDIQIADSMPLDQYPKENYTWDYDSEVAPLLNEDGTLKPHERYLYSDGAIDKDTLETVNSKFLIVTAETTNTSNETAEIYLPPQLEILEPTDAGGLSLTEYWPGSQAYHRLSVDGLPIYQSVQEFTDNNKKHVHAAELAPGETITCTFAYVVDEDCIENAYLAYYNYSGDTFLYPRVKAVE